MKRAYVIKIGGNIIDDEVKLASFLKAFAAIEGPKVLVHGGGKLATRMAEAMQVPQQMIEGRRITNAETLRIVTMVYAGYINKNIVAQLQAAGCPAIGLSGADGNAVLAHKRQAAIDYGYVGDVDAINSNLLKNLLDAGQSIVLAPITHDGKGQLLNTNADTIAQETARALSAHYEIHLVYSFEKRGVLRDAADDDSVIAHIDPSAYLELKASGVVSAGMIPKLDNAFTALRSGVSEVIIGNAGELAQLLEGSAGTHIIHE
jgi:acetylglutamate kinase